MIGALLIAIAFFLQLGGYLLYDPTVKSEFQDYVFDMIAWSNALILPSVLLGFRVNTFLRPVNIYDFIYKWFFVMFSLSFFYTAIKEQFAGLNDFYIDWDGVIYVTLLCAASLFLIKDYVKCQRKKKIT